MRQAPANRRILHVDLTPFFVAVERARDRALCGQALVVGAFADHGYVAGVSEEARAAGVEVGQPMALARRLCPQAVFLPGDLETYAHVSDQVTAILTAFSPRVERPSTDEAFVDLSASAGTMRRALSIAESVRDAIQRRLGLDCSFGLAGSRVGARIASRWARPRGLLLLLPGHEASFIRRQPLSLLDDLAPHALARLTEAGITTLGELSEAQPEIGRAHV
jgi:DNA polymerase-4